VPPAETLGRYRLLRSLGRGGMGVVHLAVAHGPAGFEKVVALKLLDERFRGDERRAEGLLREALVGGRLDHEHLVQILDLGFEVDQYFIAMEYVRGHSLSHVLAHLAKTGRQLPVFLAVRVVRAVVDAIVYMHGVLEASGQPLGLVHGDISPSNVLLGADSRVKLSDFGVVALSGEHRTQLPGKLAYFPPEAFRGQVRTQNWDVFAIGAVLYEALAGRRAFDGSGSVAHAPLAELRPDCPPALLEVVERTLAAEPAARLFRAADLAQALDAAYPGEPGDRERHRGYLQALYGEPDFVQAHGELPSESGLPGRAVQVIAVEETEQATVRAVSTARGLRFGLSQAHGSERARRSGDQLAGELTARIGRPVRTVVLADYQSVTDALASGDLDLAWMPPLALVQALDRGAGLLAVARRAGATIYHSCVLVHAESPLTRLEELAGKRAAFVDRQSASGYAFVMAGLIEALGGGTGGVGSIRAHFHGSHRAVCEAVANRWADFGASYAVLALDGAVASSAWSELTPERAGELRSIWTSAGIPGDAVAHRPHLGEQTVTQVRESLLAMARERSGAAVLRDVFHAEQLVAGSAREYEPARAVQRALAGVRI
jgi:phosphate/phosphite/phosphonate ABC transporter binding protein